MRSFYRPFSDVLASGEKFDGLIITGAPIEHLPFSEVTYWSELCQVFDWTRTHVHSTFGVCWGGMAMMNYLHGVPKHLPRRKGLRLFPSSQHGAGLALSARVFPDDCVIPVSRWTEMRRDEIEAVPDLDILLHSDDVGPCLVRGCGASRALYLQPPGI